MPASNSSMTYRPDIDGMRALAVVPVVLYHAGVPGFSGGFVGVDMFFVISGYLITRILHSDIERGRFSIGRFYERRARRILPALLAVVAASAVVGYVMLLPDSYAELAQSAMATAAFVSNIWFWTSTSSYFGQAAEFMPLLHTWSLAVEEQFYIVYPLFLWLLVGRSRRVIVAVLVSLSVSSLALAAVVVEASPAAAFYLAPTRAWELGLGAILALVVPRNALAPWLRELTAAGGLACILAAVYLYDRDTAFPGFAALLPCIGAAAVILAGAHGRSLVGRALSLRPVVFLGLISYSLYLWHWPILAFMRVRLDDVVLPPLWAAAGIAAAVGAATLSWAFIEAPFRRPASRSVRRARVFAISGAGLGAVCAVSLVIWISDGLPWRMPSELRPVAAATSGVRSDGERCLGIRPGEGLCRFPAAGQPQQTGFDYLVWGDSHADALMPGVRAAAQRAGKTGMFAGMTACPPLLGVERADRGGRECARFNDAVLSKLEERSDMPLVILTARWALAAEGVRAPGEPGGPAILSHVSRDGTESRDPQENFPLYRHGISATIRAIVETGRRVVILGNVPEMGWHVPNRIADHLRWGDPKPEPPDLEAVMRRQGRAEAVLRDLAQDPDVHFLALARHVCRPECRVMSSGRPLYADDDHMSVQGALEVLAPLLEDTIWRGADDPHEFG